MSKTIVAITLTKGESAKLWLELERRKMQLEDRSRKLTNAGMAMLPQDQESMAFILEFQKKLEEARE